MYSIPTPNLPHNYNLYQEKKKLLIDLINQLQIGDVKSDDAFKNTTERIKRQILLSPVTIEEPRVTHLESGTRQDNSPYGRFLGGTQNVHEITVEFPFTGSPELFAYMPDKVGITMGIAYQPSGQTIAVEVTLTELDKAKALSEAKSKMESTYQIVKGNNTQATEWSILNEPLLESALNTRREELLKFFS